MAPLSTPRFPLHPQAWACRALVLALACAGLGSRLHAQESGAPPAAEAARGYAIPAGTLEDALNRFGRDAGLLLSFTHGQVQGLRSPGLQGRFTASAGLAALLRGSGLEAVAQSRGSYVLRAAPAAAPVGGALPEVTVAANQLGEITEGTGSYTPGTIATATRLVLTPRETPQSISVVTRQEMDDFNLRAIDDVMRHTPGVSVVASDSERTTYYARGFAINEFQYDGIPMTQNARYAAGNTLSDMAIYDRVEVLKGATGLLTGAGNPGATINLIRKKPTRQFQGHASASAGSWDDYRALLDLGGALNASGSLRGRAVAAYQDQRSYLDHYQRQTRVFYGTLELDLGPATLLTLGADSQSTTPLGTNWGGIRLFDSSGAFNQMPRSFNHGARWAHWDQSMRTAFATLEHQFAGGWTGKLQLHHQANAYDTEMGAPNGYKTYPDPATGTGVTLDGWLGKYVGDVRNDALDAYLSGPFDLFGRRHELVVGGSVFHQKLRGENHWEPLDYPLEVPDYHAWSGDIPKPAWELARLVGETTRQSGLYTTGRFNLADSLKLILGGRLSWYDYRYTYAAPGAAATPTVKKENGVLTPYAGIVYDLGRHWSAYGSATSIFMPQSYEDGDGRRLDPLEGNSYELGLKGQFWDGRLNASLAWFQSRQDNYAQPTGGKTPTGATAYRAEQGVVTRGVDFELSGQLAPGWQVHAGYTHKVARLQGAKVTTIEPENQFQLHTSYRLRGALAGLTLGGGLRWQDQSWKKVNHPTQGSIDFAAPAYALVSLMARYEFGPRLSASLHINNLTDKKYYALTNDEYNWGAPRSVTLAMNYRF